MLKVLIADDEIHICRLICALADWESLEMTVVDMAMNGVEALEKIRCHKPDILITDIRMPGLDGLALIEQAKKVDPDLQIVIISGYAQFDYAQTAIRFGVSDYLLKPIQRSELTDTLKKLALRCINKTTIESEVQQLRKTSQQSLLHLHQKMISDFLENRLINTSKSYLQEQYQFEVTAPILQTFIMKLDCGSDSFLQTSRLVIRENAEKILEKELQPLCDAKAILVYSGCIYGLLNYAPENREMVRKALRNSLNYLESQKNLYGDVTFSVGIGFYVQTPKELNKSFESAQEAVNERLLEGCGRLFEWEVLEKKEESKLSLRQYCVEIEKCVEINDIAAAQTAITNLEKMAAKAENVRGADVLRLVFSAVQIFLTQIGAVDIKQAQTNFENKCNTCRSTKELFDLLREEIVFCLEQREQEKQNESSRPIRLAKQYVNLHYAEPFTLEDICAVTSFSATYFSALFKKETGQGFAKYVMKVRIDKAKELLQETDASVAEICTRVGYNDLKHFTQTFKKATNLSPGQYRKLYG